MCFNVWRLFYSARARAHTPRPAVSAHLCISPYITVHERRPGIESYNHGWLRIPAQRKVLFSCPLPTPPWARRAKKSHEELLCTPTTPERSAAVGDATLHFGGSTELAVADRISASASVVSMPTPGQSSSPGRRVRPRSRHHSAPSIAPARILVSFGSSAPLAEPPCRANRKCEEYKADGKCASCCV